VRGVIRDLCSLSISSPWAAAFVGRGVRLTFEREPLER
jgi:hypothetical protein